VIGSFIGLFFGLLWFLVGAATVVRPAGSVVTGIGVLLFAAAAWRVARRGRQKGGRFDRKYYIAAVVAEIVAIVATQNWLLAHRQMDLLWPAVGLIVGLHFIGLWKAMGLKRFLALAAAMAVINLIGLLPGLAPETRQQISGFGSSAALLLTAAA
jgi:hypothetical protein